MSDTPDVDALLADAERAQAEYARADTAQRMRALEGLYPREQTLIFLDETPEAAPLASPASLALAVRHLGARPLTDAAAGLDVLAGLIGMTPEATSERLRAVAADVEARNRLSRAQIRAERDLLALIGGLILARL
jgi:hypothetical protein